MAFSSATVWQVRSDGNNANGGGFDSSVGSPGTDYSNQAAAQIAYTDMVIDGTTNTKFTSAGNPVTSAHVGNVINITGGTGFTVQRVVIISQAAGVATCDKSLGTLGSTGGTGNLGGAVALPSTLAGTTPVVVPGNKIYVRSGTYSLGATTETIGADGDSSGWIDFIGYPSAGSPADADVAEASMPVFTSATNSVAIFTLTGATCLKFRNIKVTHTAATRGRGWVNATAASSHITWMNCLADGCLDGWYFSGGSTSMCSHKTYIGCTAKNSSASGTAGFADIPSSGNMNFSRYINCEAYANGNDGFQLVGSAMSVAAGIMLDNCLVSGNGRDGVRIAGTSATAQGLSITNSTFYGNTTTGLNIQNSSGTIALTLVNNIFYNTNTGISCATASVNAHLLQVNNAFGANSTANRNVNTPAGYSDITLTGDPFTDAGSRDFSLNNTSGAGAACRGVGYPAKIGIYDATTATYTDIGAAQVQLTSSGGLLTHPGMSGGMRA